MAEPKQEIEQLLNFLLPFAEEQLSKARSLVELAGEAITSIGE